MLYIPKISPIRIHQIAVGNNLPQDLGVEFYGVEYPNFCATWLINEPLTFQIFSDISIPNVTVNGTILTPTDITPSGWSGLGNYVLEYSYTPTSVGTLKFYLDDGTYFFESDEISVISDPLRLVKLQYLNSTNDYGYIGSTLLTAYVEGEFRTIEPGNEKTVYDDDRGEVTTLRSTPTESYVLNVYNTTYSVVNMLNLIWACDTVYMNGQPFQAKEVPGVEPVSFSNLFDMNVKVQRVEDDYQYFTVTNDGIEFVSDDTGELITDDNLEIIY